MTMIDLWTFQKWDTIQNAFNTHGVYTASWSKSIFVGDDNAIKSGYDTDMSTNVSMSDISAIRDQFTPAYEWLSSMMIQHGITPLELTGFTSTINQTTNLNQHNSYNITTNHEHDTNNHQLIDTNNASNESTNSYNTTNSNELTSSITNPTTNASVFNVSTTTANANASASVFSDGSANSTINDDSAYNDNVNTVSSSSSIDTIVNHSVAPIWFYAKWCKFDKDSFKITEVGGKPDRRLNAFKDSKNDLIHFRIPLERILLTDFDAWHCVLNDMPCPPASSESWSNKQWDEWFASTDKWSHERIVSSWLNCIITGSDDVLLRTLRSKSQPAFIQATCWYLKPDDVIKVYPSSKN